MHAPRRQFRVCCLKCGGAQCDELTSALPALRLRPCRSLALSLALVGSHSLPISCGSLFILPSSTPLRRAILPLSLHCFFSLQKLFWASGIICWARFKCYFITVTVLKVVSQFSKFEIILTITHSSLLDWICVLNNQLILRKVKSQMTLDHQWARFFSITVTVLCTAVWRSWKVYRTFYLKIR